MEHEATNTPSQSTSPETSSPPASPPGDYRVGPLRTARDPTEAYLLGCGFPFRHATAIPEHTEAQEAAIDRMLDTIECGGMLVVVGNRGVGKTQLAATAIRRHYLDWARARHEAGLPFRTEPRAKYTTALGMFLEIRSQIGDGDERDAIQPLCMIPVLIIDEIQERGDTAWEARTLTHIIDSRYGSLRASILIGNLTADKLLSHLGSSIASRLQESGSIIQCEWPSFRDRRRP